MMPRRSPAIADRRPSAWRLFAILLALAGGLAAFWWIVP